MKHSTDISLRGKLVLMLTTTTAVALLLMASAFISFDRSTSERDAVAHLRTVGKVIAENSNEAVAFRDTKAAVDVLNTLRQDPDILGGCTLDLEQHLLAQYHRRATDTCPAAVAGLPGMTVTEEKANSTQPVRLNGATAGYIYLEYDLAGMKSRRNHFVAIAAIYLLAALAAAMLLGYLLQGWITHPISRLSSLMQKVTESRDYSLRAESRESDEIGRLVAGFNLMLIEIQESQSRLQNQALTDELTGLPNRRLFAERLQLALVRAARSQDLVALIYLDLDGFKLVNDTLGHTVGDLLLREVAIRLGVRIRASDTLARLGGDEFTVIAEGITHIDQAGLLATSLLSQFAAPFSINGHDLSLTASLGISSYPNDALEAEQLIRKADTAMYVSKSTGRNKFTVFDIKYGDAVQERMELETQLRSAIERNEIKIHFQPEFEAFSQRLVRFEALARWAHPTLGFIPPSKFIPIAEETGLIIPIGLWVMEQACLKAFSWQVPGRAPIEIAINVSIFQLMQDDFVEKVLEILARTGLNPGLMQLELTESVLLPASSECVANICRLRDFGIGIAIDDFGTGFSSLSYLQQLPIDVIKIDRSFLTKISRDGHSRATLQSIVDLAHTLEKRVIIEGVETTAELLLARELGCDEIQGYLMGRPTGDPQQYLKAEDARCLALECSKPSLPEESRTALAPSA